MARFGRRGTKRKGGDWQGLASKGRYGESRNGEDWWGKVGSRRHGTLGKDGAEGMDQVWPDSDRSGRHGPSGNGYRRNGRCGWATQARYGEL